MPRRAHRVEQPSLELPAAAAAPSWAWEEQCRTAGDWPVAGVDEAGRGPLAGPVVAAAVVLPFGSLYEGLNDSKQVPAPERERLAAAIEAEAVAFGLGAAEPEEIDALNILRASHLAMARAIAHVLHVARFALVDGLPAKGLPCPHRALVRGDALSVSIAAASILAKVTRDRLMRAAAREYDGYGFDCHKGYPTPRHLAALRELGPCPLHRRTFRPVAELLQPAPPNPGSPPIPLLREAAWDGTAAGE